MKRDKGISYIAVGLMLWLASMLFLTPLATAQAQQQEKEFAKDVLLERRDGDITILPNGDVQVVETWEVHFIGGVFTYAFRELSHECLTATSGWEVYEGKQAYQPAPATDAQPGMPGTFDIQTTDASTKVTWFFPPTTDDTRMFTLKYMVHGSLAIYEQVDRLRWQFIEWERLYPINTAHVVVHLPASFDRDEIAVATYRYGRKAGGAEVVDGQTVAFTGEAFLPGALWDVEVAFPHGVVDAEQQAWQLRQDREEQQRAAYEAALEVQRRFYNRIAVGGALVIFFGGYVGIALLWHRYVRNTAPRQQAPAYIANPPEDLPPGMAGVLLDGKVENQHIIATMVDLACRGFLRIVEHGNEHSNDVQHTFTFERLEQDTSSLRTYEKNILHALFGNSQQRDLAALSKTFFSSIPSHKQDLYHELIEQGYITEDPDHIRNGYTRIGIVTIILGLMSSVGGANVDVSHAAPLAITIALAILAVGVGIVAISRLLQKKTAQGDITIIQIHCFKRYLMSIQQYTQVQDVVDQFDAYLPYAIAFGVQQQWGETFAAVHTPAPTWYTSDAIPAGAELDAVIKGFFDMVRQTSLVFKGRFVSSESV